VCSVGSHLKVNITVKIVIVSMNYQSLNNGEILNKKTKTSCGRGVT
jgi:hypothetical protein